MGAELQMSQQFLVSTLDSLSANIAILDEAGTIVMVNASWRRFADGNGLNWPDYGVGRNYLAIVEAASGGSDKEALQAAKGIRELIAGQRDQLYLEYPCHSHGEKRWFGMRATRFQSDEGLWVVIVHEDITERRLAEQALQEAKESAEVGKSREQVRRQALESQEDATLEALREAELRYRTVADFTYDWVYWEDPDGTLRYVSPSCERITGYTAERFINDPHLLHELILPEDREIWTEHRRQARNQGQQVEFRILGRDGEVRWIEHACQPIIDEQGTFLGFRVSNRDVTRRKQVEQELRKHREHLEQLVDERTSDLTQANQQLEQGIIDRVRAEEALRESEETFKNVSEQSPNMIFINNKGRIVYANKKCEEVMGYTREEFYSPDFDFRNVIASEYLDLVEDSFRKQMQGEDVPPYEYTLVTKQGKRLEVIITSKLIKYKGESVILGTITDITTRKQVEEVLRESENRFWDLYHNAPSVYLTVGIDGLIYQCNKRATELLDYSFEKLVGKPILELYADTPQGREKAAKVFQRFLAGESITDEELQMQKADGTPLWISLTVNAIRDATGEILESRSMAVDITERKQAEEALRESEETARALLNAPTDSAVLLESDGTIVALNETFASRLGESTDNLIGQNVFEYFPSDLAKARQIRFQKVVQTGRPVRFEDIRAERWYDNHMYPVFDAQGRVIRVAVYARDITERKRMELVMQQAIETAEATKHEEQERRQEAERRRQIAEGLADVLGALNSNQSLEEVLDLIVTQARDLLDTRAVGIYGLGADVVTLSVEASKGLLITYIAGSNIPIGQEALRQAMLSSQPVAVPDVATFPSDIGDLALDVRRQTSAGAWADLYQAWLAVPIISKGEVYGGMLLYYAEPRVFFEDEVELAVAFADQAALAFENSRLRDQIKQAAASAERGRLARDLHDAVTQTLFSASLIAEALPRVWDRQPEQGQSGLEELRQLTKGALAEMRTMLVELRPSALTEKPLGELLRHLTEATTSRTRVPVALTVDGDSSLDPNLQVALYRIAQEALNNIAKHARASHASVNLHCQPGRVALRISDDGYGFDPDDVLPDRVGMGTMRERAEQVGAALDIRSQLGHGTQVIVNWSETEGEGF